MANDGVSNRVVWQIAVDVSKDSGAVFFAITSLTKQQPVATHTIRQDLCPRTPSVEVLLYPQKTFSPYIVVRTELAQVSVY